MPAIDRFAAVAAVVVWIAVPAGQPAATPGLAMRVPVPPLIVVSDGMNRLSYELHVENRGEVPLTMSSLRIDVAVPPAPMTLRGDALARLLDATPADTPALLIPPGRHRVIYLDLGQTYEERGIPLRPRRLRHELIVTSPDGTAVASDDGDGLEVDPSPPVVLGPPLAGGPWAAVYDSSWPRGHRRVFYTVDGITRLPGRHTIDFVKLDVQGRTTREGADADLAASSLGYGAEVLAVADAVVAAVRDDMTEPVRVSAGVKHPQDGAAGNYLSLDLGHRRYAVYEHLKPGSVRVTPGQRVRRGEVVAALGFTGDSTGPHLHLHVADAARPLAGEGRPYVFDRFDVLGRYADIAALGKAPWQRDGVGRRERERPAPNTVIDFGAAR